MKTQTCIWNGTTATVYHLDKGEKIARHRHDVEHTTMVIAGVTNVEIWEETHRLIIMARGDSRVFPRAIDHEITAVDDGTIVLNMIAGEHSGDVPQQAGVALA